MGEAYAVPCDTKLNVSLAFGDMEYPIHPADLVTPAEMNNSEVVCIGAILSLTNGVGGIGDFQLGDVVMRNTYTLFDYGNWSRPGDTQPFVQLLNLTNADQAWSEFDSMQTKRIDEYFAANFNLSSFTHLDSETQTSTAMTSSAAISNIVSTTPLIQQASSVSMTSSSSRAAPSPTSKDLAAGALSHNEADNPGNLNDLIRNSYIVIGLVAFVLVFLIVVLVTSLVKKKVPRARTWENKEMAQPLNDQETFSGPSGRYSD
ncbi:hypothetical protein QCA50_003778 [Cerrena zonata]|uniref:Peptidase A1 domain-containing protein n=1 Tax=Cerrena zonata TaxID=2478898 RepID=A0AAW0GK16_9APHY